jgi:hypothetical protein
MALLPHLAVDQDRCRVWSVQTVGERFAIGGAQNGSVASANLFLIVRRVKVELDLVS